MLSNKQKHYLKSLAHAKRPIVSVGDKGLTPLVIAELEHALQHHELLKVKVQISDRGMKQQIIVQLCEQLGAELIQRLGHIATIYRRNPIAPRIQLP